MATIFCECGQELVSDNIHNYDYDFDAHTYECPNCGKILSENEYHKTAYEVGDIVEYENRKYKITYIFLDIDNQIMVELDNMIYTTTSEII